MIFALLLTACGRSSERDANGESGVQNDYSIGSIGLRDTRELSISAPSSLRFFFEAAGENLQQEMAELGIDLQLSFSFYAQYERDEYFVQMLSALEAGYGPDILYTDFNLHPYLNMGLFADIFTLIDQDPGSSRDDFFNNVLEAQRLNGRLYGIPSDFHLLFVGINASAPQSIISRFSSLDRVDMHKLMEIYNELLYTYPEYSHLSPGFNLTNMRALRNIMTDFIDWENKTTSINTERFVGYMYTIRDTFANAQPFTLAVLQGLLMENAEHMASNGESFLFAMHNVGLDPANALFEPTEPYFVHYIPIADTQGRLIAEPSSGRIAFNASADSQLVLAFTRHLITQRSELNINNMVHPILSGLFESNIEEGLRSALTQPDIQVFPSSELQIANAISRITG